MNQSVLNYDKVKIYEMLVQFPVDELKNMFYDLLRVKLYDSPKFDVISDDIKTLVEKENLNISIIEEAIEWARK
jgi:hypothetical protein